MREKVIDLDVKQQHGILARLHSMLERIPSVPQEAAGAIAVETVARLTPAMSMSEFAVMKAAQQEIDRYEADPQGYLERNYATTFRVLAFADPPPDGLGALPHVLEAALRPPQALSGAGEVQAYALDLDAAAVALLIGIGADECGELMRHRYRRDGRCRGTLLDLRLALHDLVERHLPSSPAAAGDEARAYLEALMAEIHEVQPDRPAFGAS